MQVSRGHREVQFREHIGNTSSDQRFQELLKRKRRQVFWLLIQDDLAQLVELCDRKEDVPNVVFLSVRFDLRTHKLLLT